MKIFKRILLILIFISFLIGPIAEIEIFHYGVNSFCLAQKELEIEYPKVPGVETPTTTKTALPEYIRYLFTFAIIIAGLLAFGALIYGGVRYLTSAGDPTKMADGRNQIMAGILGLIILLASYLILNTINPRLVLPEKPELEPATAGIRIYTMANCQEDEENPSFKVAGDLKNITDPELNWGFNGKKIESIKFLGSPGDLTVNLWSDIEFTGAKTPVDYPAGDTEHCKPISPVTYKSISLDWHFPGVYLYANENCEGERYGEDYVTYQKDSATLPEFNDKTKSIKFIYGNCDHETGICQDRYSAILHEKENYMGKAALFDQEQGDINCKPVSSLGVSSTTIYLKPPLKNGQPQIVGQGVRFWEDANWDKGEEEVVLPSEESYYGKDTGVWSESNLTDLDADNKITSMDMDGHYIALLFRDEDFGGDCEVFTGSDPDFRNNRIGRCSCGLWGPSRCDCLSSFIIKARK